MNYFIIIIFCRFIFIISITIISDKFLISSRELYHIRKWILDKVYSDFVREKRFRILPTISVLIHDFVGESYRRAEGTLGGKRGAS